MITYETFHSFCSDDPVRVALNYALRTNKGWWATDAQVFIFVPHELCHPDDIRFLGDDLPPEAGRYPDVNAAARLDLFSPQYDIPLTAIEQTLSHLPLIEEETLVEQEINYITCPECNGSGDLELEDSVYYKGKYYECATTADCPICNGHGKIPDFDGYDPTDEYDPECDLTRQVLQKTGRLIPDLEASLIRLPDGRHIVPRVLNDIVRVAKEHECTTIQISAPNITENVIFRLNGIFIGGVLQPNKDDELPLIPLAL